MRSVSRLHIIWAREVEKKQAGSAARNPSWRTMLLETIEGGRAARDRPVCGTSQVNVQGFAMRGKRMTWLILTIALLAWPVWEVCRWELVRRIYSTEEEPCAPTITPKHVQALRKLRFAWNTIYEGGGPIVDPWSPYGSKNMATDLGPILGTRDKVEIARFHREVSSLLIWALKNGKLADGDYKLAHLDNASMERRLRRELARYSVRPERVEEIVAELPRLDPDGQFRFTDQHRRLLHELRMEWPDWQTMSIVADYLGIPFPGAGYPAPTVHFKRPYGDMSAFEIDMAAILDLPLATGEEVPGRIGGKIDPTLDRLYWEMWPALQAFVEHVEVDLAPRPHDCN